MIVSRMRTNRLPVKFSLTSCLVILTFYIAKMTQFGYKWRIWTELVWTPFYLTPFYFSLLFEMYLTIFLWSSIIESFGKEIQMTAHPVHFLQRKLRQTSCPTFEKKLHWHYGRRGCLLPIFLFRLSEINFGGVDASFPLRERTQVHLCHPKEKFIKNEEGPKDRKEN